MPRPPSVLCVIGVATLLLSGCTEPNAPGATEPSAPPVAESPTEPSASPSPSPEPEPVVVPPQRPAAMDDGGYKGAAAAAEYFKLLDEYIMKTNDTAEWEAMSHEECSTCDDRLEQARLIAANDYTYVGGESTVRISHVYEQDSATGIWPVDVETSIKPTTILDSNQEEIQTLDAVSGTQRFEVLRVDDRWVIVGIAGIEDEA
jgi:hypothetical protein